MYLFYERKITPMKQRGMLLRLSLIYILFSFTSEAFVVIPIPIDIYTTNKEFSTCRIGLHVLLLIDLFLHKIDRRSDKVGVYSEEPEKSICHGRGYEPEEFFESHFSEGPSTEPLCSCCLKPSQINKQEISSLALYQKEWIANFF